MQTIQTIHSSQSHFGWDNSIAPVMIVEPGTDLDIELREASGGQLSIDSDPSALTTLDFDRVNPVTGPVYINGAEPGDALKVTILAASFKNDARVPLRPFAGTIGVALAEPGLHSVVPPRRVGGNLDVRDLCAGTILYLPIEVRGALFSVGDGHAAQGDGEVCGTAIETTLGVSLNLDIVKGANIPGPRFETLTPITRHLDSAGYLVTTGVGPDLMQGAKNAVRSMIDLLQKRTRMAPEDAYMLCSVSADLCISEIVDAPNWVVSCYFPRIVIEG